MKSIFVFISLLAIIACTKQVSVPEPTPKDAYYRLVIKDIDSNYTYSVVEFAKVTEYIGSSNDDNENYCKCHPNDPRCKALPISLEYFTVTATSKSTLVEWKSTHEDRVDYYQVEKSTDGLRYDPVSKPIKPKGPGIYKILFL